MIDDVRPPTDSAGRLEDNRLLTGRGNYVADISLPGMLEVAFVRSPLPHALILGIDLDTVRADPRVAAAVDASDLEGVSPFPDYLEYSRPVAAFPLAKDRARFAGAPVVAVVAADRYTAEDCAELVEVDYEPLDAVTGVEEARDGTAYLYPDWPDNTIMHIPGADLDRFFEGRKVVTGSYRVQRHTAVPLETRGVVAEYRQGRLTVWTNTQSPHITRTTLAMMLGMSETAVRVVAPDIGGGFGAKTHIYGEQVVVAWLARRLGVPCRWVEDRGEHLRAASHARQQVHELEAAIDDDGSILAIRGAILGDVGSGEIFMPGLAPSLVSAAAVSGPYKIPHSTCSITNYVTNKAPSGAYRGFGLPEMVFALERFIEKVAAETGRDSTELRRSMIFQPDDLPYTTNAGSVVDSGSHREALDAAVAWGDTARTRFTDSGPFRHGVGYATYVEGTAPTYFATTGRWSAQESASLRVEPDGTVVVATGMAGSGQGTETMVATLAASLLGVRASDVTVAIGDTDSSPYGLGAWGSRATVVASGALAMAGNELRAKIKAIGAYLLEAAPEDLVIADGAVHVGGTPSVTVSLARIAEVAYFHTFDLPPGVTPGLEATATYDPPGLQHRPDNSGKINASTTYANATHAAVVRVDVETGQVRVVGYFVAHDCGHVVNPQIVDGQIHGGVAQGIGGALLEELPYSEAGDPLATSFLDYLMPAAVDVPPLEIAHFASPSPNTVFGVKGAGEGGAIGPPGAIANAVADALRSIAGEVVETPLTPERVRALIEQGPER